MAIDSASKRYNMMDFCTSPYGPSTPIPDGTIAANDRLHFLWLYGGNAVAAETSRTNGFSRRRRLRSRRRNARR